MQSPDHDKSDLERAEHNRVIWHSRRGMLELDLVLEPFVKQAYVHLDAPARELYRRLLTCEDQDLFNWFLQKEPASDAELAAMVSQILAFNRTLNLSGNN